jgi:phosphoglycerate dehydrogenase-like enzyme
VVGDPVSALLSAISLRFSGGRWYARIDLPEGVKPMNSLFSLAALLFMASWTIPIRDIPAQIPRSAVKIMILETTLDRPYWGMRPTLSGKEIEGLRQSAPEAEFFVVPVKDALSRIGEADAMIGEISPEMVRAGRKLRWVQAISAGVEDYICPEMIEQGITLTNLRIIQGPEVADHAMALLLSLTRCLTTYIPTRGDKNWAIRHDFEPIELRGKTVLIIGLGGIGTQVAERAHAFGMRVLAIDVRDAQITGSVERLGFPEQLHEFIPRADVIICCVPHTPATQKMLGPREFELVKKGAYFVNVSRGKVVQTDSLVAALQEGRLAGAGLDVLDPEPLPADHPLWSFRNVVITPHIATKSDAMPERRMELFKDNVRRFVRGLPLRNVVDKRAGY